MIILVFIIDAFFKVKIHQDDECSRDHLVKNVIAFI